MGDLDARRAAARADIDQTFNEHLATLRERHRRRPTLIAMLDKAKLPGSHALGVDRPENDIGPQPGSS